MKNSRLWLVLLATGLMMMTGSYVVFSKSEESFNPAHHFYIVHAKQGEILLSPRSGKHATLILGDINHSVSCIGEKGSQSGKISMTDFIQIWTAEKTSPIPPTFGLVYVSEENQSKVVQVHVTMPKYAPESDLLSLQVYFSGKEFPKKDTQLREPTLYVDFL